MSDIFSKVKRSEIMSKIRSKWSAHEKIAHNHLKARKIRHVMHPEMLGNPDILIKDTNTVVFLDGCFWHGCPQCYRRPQSNMKYWESKIEYNTERDKKIRANLKKQGFRVVAFWEHEFSKKNLNGTIQKIVELSIKN